MLASVIVALVGQGSGLPRPTGRNGYEEYVQAAEILKAPGASLLIGWQPGMKPPAPDPGDPNDKGPSKAVLAEYARLNAMTPLEVRREALRRFGRALTLVAQGNSKPVFDPRPSFEVDTAFSELAEFRAVTRLAAAAATVYAADGRTDQATRTLIDQLVFADKFGRGVMIANLVGIASTAIAVRGFEELLPRMSLRDAQAVSTSVAALLARPASVVDTMVAEAKYQQVAAREAVMAKPGPDQSKDLESGEEMDPRMKRLAAEFMKLAPASRQSLLQSVNRRLEMRTQQRIRVLQGPEKDWIRELGSLNEDEDERPETLTDLLVSVVDGGTFGQFLQASLRTRAQLRILSLHAQVVAYRWQHGRLPESLDAVDPLSGEPFIYQANADGTIRIASRGTKETGEIELRYRRPAPIPDVKP